MIKKLLPLIFITLGCAPSLKYVDNLVVNKKDYRTVSNMTEEEGIENIREIINKNNDEPVEKEAWAYLNGIWVEFGINKKGQFAYDTLYLRELMEENNKITIYCFNDYKKILKDTLEKDTSMTEEEILKLEKKLKANEAIPSKELILYMIGTTLEGAVYRCTTNVKVCSRKGVTEFYLTDPGKELSLDLILHDRLLGEPGNLSLKSLSHDICKDISICDGTIKIINRDRNKYYQFNQIMEIKFTPYK